MSTCARLTSVFDVRAYLNAEHATFTLVSTATENRLTYSRWNSDHGCFVSALTGPDNESDYTPLGKLWHPPGAHSALRLYPLKKVHISQDAPAWRGLQWFLQMLAGLSDEDRLPDSIEFWHSGYCARCGRELTTPESIERGLGPVCATKAQ